MDSVTFKLEVFEGPLDLLLHLISKNKIDIYDIPIVDIVDQYSNYLAEMQRLDLDIAADFIVMSAQLMYIKAKMLLPKYEEDEEDPRTQLVNALLEYQRFKEASEYLHKRDEERSEVYVKSAEHIEPDKEYQHVHDASILVKAIRNMLEKADSALPPEVKNFDGIIKHEEYPVENKIQYVLSGLARTGKTGFLELLSVVETRSEAVATFLAVLELFKEGRISLEEHDGDYAITLTK